MACWPIQPGLISVHWKISRINANFSSCRPNTCTDRANLGEVLTVAANRADNLQLNKTLAYDGSIQLGDDLLHRDVFHHPGRGLLRRPCRISSTAGGLSSVVIDGIFLSETLLAGVHRSGPRRFRSISAGWATRRQIRRRRTFHQAGFIASERRAATCSIRSWVIFLIFRR